jgi:YVTN family beta-propeller protein
MGHLKLASLVIGLISGASSLAAQQHGWLFVENSQSGDVTVIDATTLRVAGSIPIGLSPDEIVASPSGDVLYVARIVRRDDGRPTGTGELIAIDPAARSVVWRAPLRGSPNHIAVSPDGRRVYVTIVSGSWVDIVDATKHAVVDVDSRPSTSARARTTSRCRATANACTSA